ncbi:transmembrane protein 207 [Orycteropus afer afer]|uniref:Transmembrane protein 207 n=1 Tax=Orycteropus afer afer TaxID=1230840 RepID=A0A8B6ZJL5_ORYAF|nr:transmembrane protein 207 [Orycteropus afer afer]
MFGFYCSKHVFQLVLSDPSCEENETCINYNNQHPNGWYIWFLLLIFLLALLCGAVLCCLQCCLKRSQVVSPRRTMAVFAIGDLDHVYGTEAAVSPNIGIHLQCQNPELYSIPCFGPPPPYEEILKTSQF